MVFLFFVFKVHQFYSFILFLPLKLLEDADREALIHLTTLSFSSLCMKLCRPAARFHSIEHWNREVTRTKSMDKCDCAKPSEFEGVAEHSLKRGASHRSKTNQAFFQSG